MSKKSNSITTNFLKVSFINLFIGFAFMFLVTLVFSGLLDKIKHYEVLYPAISVFLCCIPSFVAARRTANRFEGMLLPTAFFQGILTVLILVMVSAIMNGSFAKADSFLTTSAFIFPSAIIAVLLPKRKRKRH